MPEPGGAGEVENVRVIVRVRPLNSKEIEARCRNIIQVNTIAKTVTVTKPNGSANAQPKTFTFDCVFDENSKQAELYVEIALPLIDKVLEGYNGTILAYGQTGTGKTYTMAGLPTSPELRGIIPNTFAHIFSHISKADDKQKFLVRVTYLEIYNEEVRDLLGKDPCRSLEVKERPDIGVFVKNLSGYVVHNADDLDKIMQLGNKNRVIGATAMNSESSRSHAIFSITVESSEVGEDKQQHVKMGKLHLVDLAGSERQSKTLSSGTRLKEATKINLSLSVLGNVISALVDGKSTHIPYRNSKLTRLLQDSLGGNSKTVMCANIGPADINFDETVSTLRYANRAKNIENRAHVNEEPKDALLRHFQEEIEELMKQLEANDNLEAEIETTQSEEESDEASDSDDEFKKPRKNKRNKQSEGNSDEKTDNEKEDDEENPIKKNHEVELNQTKSEQAILREKLQSLQNKILVGGENLLEKAQTQEQLLESSAAELELRKASERNLRESIQLKEAERIDIEERYTTLQEENLGKTKRLERAVQLYQTARADIADLQQENQREMESMFDNVRSLTRELQLTDLILDSYIPKEYQKIIENYSHYNEDIGEWQLRGVAFTGNNMRKQIVNKSSGHNKEPEPLDLSHVYLSYNTTSLTEPVRAKTASSSSQNKNKNRASRGSGVPRPTTKRQTRTT